MTTREEVSIFDLWAVVLAKRILIAAVSATVFLFALAYAFLSTPVYRAQVVLIEAEAEQPSTSISALAGQFGGLASLAGIRADSNSLKLEALATLRSRAFLEEFIVDLKIMPHLYRDLWDVERQVWLADDPSEIPTLSKAYEYFRDNVMTVSDVSEQGVITIAIDTEAPEIAAKWANDIILRLNEKLRRRSVAEAQKSIEYLNDELSKTSIVELQLAIYRMIETQINTIMMASVREEYAFRVIDPAQPPDQGNFVRPKRLLALAVGAIGGVLLGLFAAFFMHGFQNQRSEYIRRQAI
jgi:uncharacterized protein involved in exopolysaccharide biosynthesis